MCVGAGVNSVHLSSCNLQLSKAPSLEFYIDETYILHQGEFIKIYVAIRRVVVGFNNSYSKFEQAIKHLATQPKSLSKRIIFVYDSYLCTIPIEEIPTNKAAQFTQLREELEKESSKARTSADYSYIGTQMHYKHATLYANMIYNIYEEFVTITERE